MSRMTAGSGVAAALSADSPARVSLQSRVGKGTESMSLRGAESRVSRDGNLFFRALRLLRCARNNVFRENAYSARLNGYPHGEKLLDKLQAILLRFSQTCH